MSTLYIALTIALVFISIAIVVLVLLQKGKGAEAGAAFGAGASGTVFGARGTGSFLTRATAVLATLFFMNCLALAYLSGQRTGPESLLQEETGEAGGGPAQLLPDGELDDSLPVFDGAQPEATDFDELPALDDAGPEAADPDGLPALDTTGEEEGGQ